MNLKQITFKNFLKTKGRKYNNIEQGSRIIFWMYGAKWYWEIFDVLEIKISPKWFIKCNSRKGSSINDVTVWGGGG